MIRRLALGVLALVSLVLCARAGEIPEKAPSADAKPLVWQQSQAKNGLRFAWLVPKGYDGKTKRDLTVILHGSNLDYRWGPMNNPAGVFRPADIVVSVDGTTPNGEARNFLDDKKDLDAFAAFLAEMRAAFAVDRVFLYGHSQGGFFVVRFAGDHPDVVAGVVAHASGSWLSSKMSTPVKKVAIAFQHGTLDPVVPYVQSVASRDAYAKAGFPLLHLRRLDTYNHWPNAVRSTESIDWCEGMTTTDPARAYAAAERILAPKKADEYQWETVVGYAGARDVLRRLEKKGPAPFGEVSDEIAKKAATAITKVEAEGARHVAALEKSVKTRKDLTLKGASWLGHLVPLREDFRGVDSVETYVEKIGYDDELASQQKAANAIVNAWDGSSPPKAIYETIVTNLPGAFLVEGLPAELAERMKTWKSGAKGIGLDAKLLKKHADFEAWTDGWKSGSDAYRDVWKSWKGL